MSESSLSRTPIKLPIKHKQEPEGTMCEAMPVVSASVAAETAVERGFEMQVRVLNYQQSRHKHKWA